MECFCVSRDTFPSAGHNDFYYSHLSNFSHLVYYIVYRKIYYTKSLLCFESWFIETTHFWERNNLLLIMKSDYFLEKIFSLLYYFMNVEVNIIIPVMIDFIVSKNIDSNILKRFRMLRLPFSILYSPVFRPGDKWIMKRQRTPSSIRLSVKTFKN